MIGKQHMGITEEVLDSLGRRWTKKEGEVRWYVAEPREVISGWCKSQWSGVKVWLDRDGAVHVDHSDAPLFEKDVIAKMDAIIEAAMPVDVPEIVLESAELAFAAEPEDEEAEDEVGAIEVLVVRKADGKAAKVEVPDIGEDLWTCIGAAYPRSYDLMDESMVTPSEHIEGWDESFRPGEDPELAAWLQECEAVAVELDELGRVTGAVAGFEGERGWAIRKAVEAAEEFIENSGCDTSELRVEVRIGDETVWEWEDSGEVA